MKKIFKFIISFFRANRDTSSPTSFPAMFRSIYKWVKSDNGIVTMLLALAAVLLYNWAMGDANILTATAMVIGGTASGKHVVRGPLTTGLTDEAAPGLLRNDIDDRIVKIRPMSTPIDQISRWAGARSCGSMKVEYYSVDTKPTKSTITAEIDSEVIDDNLTASIQVSNPEIFEASETILVPGVMATDADGNDNGALVLYVVKSAETGNKIEVLPVNNFSSNGKKEIPEIASGQEIIRMGRAATELDVQTPQFQALPKKDHNYCQIFK